MDVPRPTTWWTVLRIAMDRIIVRTNFTNTAPQKHEIDLDRLDAPESIRVLWAVFYDPDRLRPDVRSEGVTEEAARRIGGDSR